MQRAFDLAATQCVRNLLAQRRLQQPQFLGELELHIEVTVIDGAQFPGERANLGLCGFSREACHTV